MKLGNILTCRAVTIFFIFTIWRNLFYRWKCGDDPYHGHDRDGNQWWDFWDRPIEFLEMELLDRFVASDYPLGQNTHTHRSSTPIRYEYQKKLLRIHNAQISELTSV